MSIFSGLLIGGKYECYIVEEVSVVDELDEGNISAAKENLGICRDIKRLFQSSNHCQSL